MSVDYQELWDYQQQFNEALSALVRGGSLVHQYTGDTWGRSQTRSSAEDLWYRPPDGSSQWADFGTSNVPDADSSYWREALGIPTDWQPADSPDAPDVSSDDPGDPGAGDGGWTAPPPTGGSNMGWTAYHDNLMSEMMALLTEPNWHQTPEITDRLNVIRQELQQASQSLGMVPVLDEFGQQLLDETGQPIMQTQQEAFAGLFSEMEQARQAAEAATQQRYDQLIGGDPSQIMSYPEIAAAIQSGYLDPALAQMLGVQSQFADQMSAAQQVYGDHFASMYGQDGHLAQLLGGYDQLGQQAQDLHGRVLGDDGYISQLGGVAREDIAGTASQERARIEQEMAQRGLGNTTIQQSMQSGVSSREAQELRRLEEQLAQMRMGADVQLTGQELGLGERGIGAGMTGVGMQDAWLSQMLGAQQAGAGMQASLGAQTAQQGQQTGGMMASLWGQAPSVIERRTDTGPSLADIFNVAMQAGRGSTSMFALPGFFPGTSYQPPAGE